MNDYKMKFEVEDKIYNLVFNLNVMQDIQEEYGTLEKWGALTDGRSSEVNAKALIFGLTAMINEGIEIENDEKGLNNPTLTVKQVGRIISKIGIDKSAEKLNDAVLIATQNDNPKNA